MIELPDDELDKLVRKSYEEHDPTYEPEDWNALSRRLDQKDGKTSVAGFHKWWTEGLLVLLVLISLIIYFLLNEWALLHGS